MHPFLHVYHKWRSSGVWFLRYKTQWTVLCHFEPFSTFDPPKSLKNQNFETMKKTPGDTILDLLTTNENHMMYGSWDMENATNFTPLLTPKIKIWKNLKNTCSFSHVYHKWRSHDAWFLRYKAQWTVFCHFGPFFAFWPS